MRWLSLFFVLCGMNDLYAQSGFSGVGYWDDEATPSVEVPVGDFFGMGWGVYSPLQSLAICVNPGSAFNCYRPMPFRKKCRITMENIDLKDMVLYYQVDYILTEMPSSAAYFHAQFRRANR